LIENANKFSQLTGLITTISAKFDSHDQSLNEQVDLLQITTNTLKTLKVSVESNDAGQ
jgi:hypothetical protein